MLNGEVAPATFVQVPSRFVADCKFPLVQVNVTFDPERWSVNMLVDEPPETTGASTTIWPEALLTLELVCIRQLAGKFAGKEPFNSPNV